MSVTMVLYGLGLCRFIAFLLLGYSQRENEINARSNSKQACILVVLLITKKVVTFQLFIACCQETEVRHYKTVYTSLEGLIEHHNSTQSF